MRRGRRAPPAAPVPRAVLEEAMGHVALDYLGFVRPGANEDPKVFAARHTAGRTALAHLTELCLLAAGEAAPEDAEAAVEGVLESARARLASEAAP